MLTIKIKLATQQAVTGRPRKQIDKEATATRKDIKDRLIKVLTEANAEKQWKEPSIKEALAWARASTFTSFPLREDFGALSISVVETTVNVRLFRVQVKNDKTSRGTISTLETIETKAGDVLSEWNRAEARILANNDFTHPPFTYTFNDTTLSATELSQGELENILIISLKHAAKPHLDETVCTFRNFIYPVTHALISTTVRRTRSADEDVLDLLDFCNTWIHYNPQKGRKGADQLLPPIAHTINDVTLTIGYPQAKN
jgi:hypothetical protein